MQTRSRRGSHITYAFSVRVHRMKTASRPVAGILPDLRGRATYAAVTQRCGAFFTEDVESNRSPKQVSDQCDVRSAMQWIQQQLSHMIHDLDVLSDNGQPLRADPCWPFFARSRGL